MKGRKKDERRPRPMAPRAGVVQRSSKGEVRRYGGGGKVCRHK